MCEQIVDVQMVEQSVNLLHTESQDRIQQRTAEQIVDTSVPQVAEGLEEVFKFFSPDRIQRFEKKTVEIRQPQIIEKIDETPKDPDGPGALCRARSAGLSHLWHHDEGWCCDWRGSVREGEEFPLRQTDTDFGHPYLTDFVREMLCTTDLSHDGMAVSFCKTLEPTRVRWKSDRARADEVRQAYVY